MVPVPTAATMVGHTGIYLKILIGVSTLALVGQLAFQIVLFSMPPYGGFLEVSKRPQTFKLSHPKGVLERSNTGNASTLRGVCQI